MEFDLPIVTDRLVLRAHQAEDLDDLMAFHGDPAVVRYVPWPVRDRSATEAALQVKLGQGVLTEPGQWLVLAVELRETGTVIGEVLLKWVSAENQQGEFGFAVAREYQGRGLAHEAAAALVRFGFDVLGLHRMIAVCIEQNSASARLLRRLGFRQEARLVDNVWFKGEWCTQLLFAVTRDALRPDAAGRDLEELRAMVRCFFAAFTSGTATEVDVRLDALRRVLLEQAVIIRTCGTEPTAYEVESFISPRRAMLVDGTLMNFTERPTGGRIEIFGDVAHWFGSYTKDGEYQGAPYPGAGMKSIQFVRTGTGWRISAVAWDDIRAGLVLADHTADRVD